MVNYFTIPLYACNKISLMRTRKVYEGKGTGGILEGEGRCGPNILCG